MRKMFFIPLIGFLVLAAACSSSTKKALPTDPVGAASAEGKATCVAAKDFTATVASVGSTPAQFKASAAKLHTISTALVANPPAKVAANVKAAGVLINQTADKLAVATTSAQATQAIAPMVYNASGNKDVTAYTNWVKANCV
jgi:hypothetical protein